MKKTLFVLGLLLACVSCFAGDEQKKENDGFVWTLRMNADSVAEALDAAGNVIIPADRGYRFIQYIPEIKDKMISVMAGFNVGYTPDGTIVGACDMKGEEIVPVAFRQALCFKQKALSYYMVLTPDSLYGILDETGRTLVVPHYYNRMPNLSGDKFEVCNYTIEEMANLNVNEDFILVTINVSNPIKSYYAQQKFLTDAINKKVSTDELLLEAFVFEENGDAKKAIDKLNVAIKQKPSSLAYYHRGLCNYLNKEWKKAAEDLHYVFFLDDATPDLIDKADSVLYLAEEEMMGKKLRRQQRLQKLFHVIDAIHGSMEENIGLIRGNSQDADSPATTNSSFSLSNSSTGTNIADNTGTASRNQHSHSRRCTVCGGDGKCRGRYHCHGTGVCNWCNGEGTTQVQGRIIKCVNCNGTGKCSFCRGSKKCQRCNGRGTT